jgi:hypothetical protein
VLTKSQRIAVNALTMNRPRLSDLTADQSLARAAECWRMAETASTAAPFRLRVNRRTTLHVREGLIGLK